MSVCSMMSEMSITLNGQERSLESAIDETYKELQKSLNNSQCSLRTLCQRVDNNEYEESLIYNYEVVDYITNMQELFNDLKKICKSILMKPENDEEKAILAKFKEDRKSAGLKV